MKKNYIKLLFVSFFLFLVFPLGVNASNGYTIENYEVDIKLISENLDKYTGGTIIIPSYLSKGLEFDSVIISDSNKYSENILDIKLLYVACTRAMHTLDIISQ